MKTQNFGSILSWGSCAVPSHYLELRTPYPVGDFA